MWAGAGIFISCAFLEIVGAASVTALAKTTSNPTADFTSLMQEGLAADYDRLMQRLCVGGMATALGYIEASELKNVAPGKSDPSTGELSRALIDLFSLELWLRGFFGRTVTR